MMTSKWKVGDRVRSLVNCGVLFRKDEQGRVMEVDSDTIVVAFDGKPEAPWWARIRIDTPIPELEKVNEEFFDSGVFPPVKVEVGGETVLDTTATRSRAISPILVRGYAICDPRDNSSLRVTLQTYDESDQYILVRRENTDEVMTFDGDLEELKTLLEVAEKLLQKE